MKIKVKEMEAYADWNQFRVTCYNCKYTISKGSMGLETIKHKRQVIKNAWVRTPIAPTNALESDSDKVTLAFRNRLLKEFGEILTLNKLNKCLIKMGFKELKELRGFDFESSLDIDFNKYQQLPIKLEG